MTQIPCLGTLKGFFKGKKHMEKDRKWQHLIRVVRKANLNAECSRIELFLTFYPVCFDTEELSKRFILRQWQTKICEETLKWQTEFLTCLLVFAVLCIPAALCEPSAIQGFTEITEQSVSIGGTARHADVGWVIPSSRKEEWSLLLQCQFPSMPAHL